MNKNTVGCHRDVLYPRNGGHVTAYTYHIWVNQRLPTRQTNFADP